MMHCNVCSKKVTDRHHAIQCNVCLQWQHCLCNTGISLKDYKRMVREKMDIQWSCHDCQVSGETKSVKEEVSNTRGRDFAMGVPVVNPAHCDSLPIDLNVTSNEFNRIEPILQKSLEDPELDDFIPTDRQLTFKEVEGGTKRGGRIDSDGYCFTVKEEVMEEEAVKEEDPLSIEAPGSSLSSTSLHLNHNTLPDQEIVIKFEEVVKEEFEDSSYSDKLPSEPTSHSQSPTFTTAPYVHQNSQHPNKLGCLARQPREPLLLHPNKKIWKMTDRGLPDDEIGDLLFVDDASDGDIDETPALVHKSGDMTEEEEGVASRSSSKGGAGTGVSLPPPRPSPAYSTSSSDSSQATSLGVFYGRAKRQTVRESLHQFRRLYYDYHDDEDEEMPDNPLVTSDNTSRISSPDQQIGSDSSDISSGPSGPRLSSCSKGPCHFPVKLPRRTTNNDPTSPSAPAPGPSAPQTRMPTSQSISSCPKVSRKCSRGRPKKKAPATPAPTFTATPVPTPVTATPVPPPVTAIPVPPPVTATSVPPVSATPVPPGAAPPLVVQSQLGSSEVKSRKRARGPIRDNVGTPLVQFHARTTGANDGSIWHRDTNPNLPRISATQRLPPGQLTITADLRKRPDELFELFVPDIELAAIEYYTNRKINSLRARFHHQDSATTEPLTVMELKALLGILIVSGIKEDNHVGTDQMWSPFDGCPLYRSTMTNRRFCFLMRALRFDNLDTRPQRLLTDKLAPIRALWDACLASCRSCYEPGPHFTIDEQLLAFRGKCSFRMFIANKPAKYGLKIVMLCDADTHFMCNAEPYLGKGQVTLPANIKTYGEYYLTELTNPFPRRGRTVTTDNWFSTLQGALSLRNRGLEFTGTIKTKPYLPKAIFDTDLAVGQTVAVFNYDKLVTLICHRGSKTKKNQLLSTIHHYPTVVEKVKTDIQMFYNATKDGVVTFDQLCTKTSCSRMTNRWPLCFFFGILNLSYTNSYILHQVQTQEQKTLTRREFGMKLGEQLCRPWALKRLQITTLPRELRCLIGSVYGVVSDNHPDEPAPGRQQGPRPRQRCYLCPRNSNTKSRERCSTCQKFACPRHFKITCDSCST